MNITRNNSFSIGLNFLFKLPGTFIFQIFGVHLYTWRKTSRLNICRISKIPCDFLTQFLPKNHWSHRNYVSLWVYTASKLNLSHLWLAIRGNRWESWTEIFRGFTVSPGKCR